MDEIKLTEVRDKLKSIENKFFDLIEERINLGIEVAEIKYPMIKELLDKENSNKEVNMEESSKNSNKGANMLKILTLITNSEVERKIIERVSEKANTLSNNNFLQKIMVNLYKDFLIPETKIKQIEYLSDRLNE
jgi:chorismate mutase